jgi:hypothetical protein
LHAMVMWKITARCGEDAIPVVNPPPQKLCVDLCVQRCSIITCLQSDEILECVCSRTYMPYHYIVGRNYLNIVSASVVTSFTSQQEYFRNVLFSGPAARFVSRFAVIS